MKKFIWIIVILVVLVLLFLTNVKPQSPTSDGPIKIGAILPLSGDFGSIGEEIRRGAELAVEELGKQGKEIILISEDDQFLPVRAASAANKLAVIDKVDAVFTAVGEEARPVTKIFNDNKVPLLVAFDSNEELKKSGDYIFSIGFGTEANGEKLATYTYNTLGLKKIAVLSHVDNVADILSEAFKNKFTQLGGTISSHDRIQTTEDNFRTYIVKVKADQPDGVYFVFLPPSNEIFLKQTGQLGLKTTLLGSDAIQKFEIENAGPAAEGLIFTGFYVEDEEGITQLYKNKFGKEPDNPAFVASGYDSIITLAAGKTIANEEKITLREALMRVSTNETTFPVNMNGTQFSERLEKIYKVTNGESQVIE